MGRLVQSNELRSPSSVMYSVSHSEISGSNPYSDPRDLGQSRIWSPAECRRRN